MTDVQDEAAANLTAQVQEEIDSTVVKAKAKPEPHPCLCSQFAVGEDIEDENGQLTRNEFTTECDRTTQSTFAQGHDARLVSFLVSGELDGYLIYRADGEGQVTFTGAGHAAASISEALGAKADKALLNERAKLSAKQAKREEREGKRAEQAQARAEAKAARAAEAAARKAAKEQEKADKKAAAAARKAEAAGPREVGAEVVEGSLEGDAPRVVEAGEGERLITIKVGRFTTEAVLKADGVTVEFIDAKGELNTRHIDNVRVLTTDAS